MVYSLDDMAAALHALLQSLEEAAGRMNSTAAGCANLVARVADFAGPASVMAERTGALHGAVEQIAQRLIALHGEVDDLPGLVEAWKYGGNFAPGGDSADTGIVAGGATEANFDVIIAELAAVRGTVADTASAAADAHGGGQELAEGLFNLTGSQRDAEFGQYLTDTLDRAAAELAALSGKLDEAVALATAAKGVGTAPAVSEAVRPSSAAPRHGGSGPTASLADPRPFPKYQEYLDALPARPDGKGPTTGVLTTPDGRKLADVRSGKTGPGHGGPGLRHPWAKMLVANDHAEGHTAALMRGEGGPREATLYLNNAPCRFPPFGCDQTLPAQLPQGARLTIHWPGGSKLYIGTGEGVL